MSTPGGPAAPSGFDWRLALFALLAACGLALLLLEPALRGPVVSDDLLLLSAVPEQGLGAEGVAAVLDPRGDPVQITANWAPVHLLAHMLASAGFGSPAVNPYPHHLLNGVLHGVNAVLLAALLATHGVPLAAALAAGLLFLVHPANAETAAWMFQLKTLLAFAFGIGALLWLPRRPLLATLLFALALFSKPSAAAVLAAAIVFAAQGRPAGAPRRTAWLGAWALLLALYAIPELGAFFEVGEFRAELPRGAALLQAVAIAGRYAVLAVAGWGASTFHQPLPPASPLDPWFLLGAATLLGLAAVSVRALLRGSAAAGWLGLAAAAYRPVAQLFPFRFPMADRYLYFVWPGLIGAALVAAAPWLRRNLTALSERGVRGASPVFLGAALAAPVVAAVWAVTFYERAAVWSTPERVEYDSARHYPEGIPGQMTLARRLLAEGDADGAVLALERARARGHTNPAAYFQDAALQPLLQHPRYLEMLQEMTQAWIARAESLPNPTVASLMGLAQAQLFLGQVEPAFANIDRAMAKAGPGQRAMIEQFRRSFEEAIRSQGGATP